MLNLTRVSAPLFVCPKTGLNDNLSGVERPVSFDVKNMNGSVVEIVQSLAKWKRAALKRYGFSAGEGIYTDMNAIRRMMNWTTSIPSMLINGTGKRLSDLKTATYKPLWLLSVVYFQCSKSGGYGL